jgi:TonB family protein
MIAPSASRIVGKFPPDSWYPLEALPSAYTIVALAIDVSKITQDNLLKGQSMSGYRPPSSSWERPAQQVARAFIECLESADMERLCERASPSKAFHEIASRLKDDEALRSDVLLVKAHETRAAGQFQSSSDAAPPHGPISAWPHWFRSATDGVDMPLLYLLRSDSVAKLRAHLNSIKRYPTGREASQLKPQGKVRVWFVLRRDGSVVDLGIDESSNSMLLDDAARKTINRAAFTAFPEGSWSGANTHRFTADLEFIPASG